MSQLPRVGRMIHVADQEWSTLPCRAAIVTGLTDLETSHPTIFVTIFSPNLKEQTAIVHGNTVEWHLMDDCKASVGQ